MKKILRRAVYVFLTLMSGHTVEAGTDATNAYLILERTTINGTNATQVQVFYSTNSTARQLQMTTGLGGTNNNWFGVQFTNQVSPRVNSPAGEVPKWSKFFIKTEGDIGVQIFRVLDTVVTNPPPEIPQT